MEVDKLKREEMLSLIRNELSENPNATSREISKKYRIPIFQVILFRIKTES